MNTPELPLKTWSDIGFEVEITEDGSPSLRQIKSDLPDRPGESMHHSGGAAAETELIYGKPIRKCFEALCGPHFISVGLGLGYVELVIAREALLKNDLNFTMESWELVPELREWFLSWLEEAPLPRELEAVYNQVLQFIARDFTLDPTAVKRLLSEKQKRGEWLLQGPLITIEKPERLAHGILFDAFSAKTTPSLWTEDFLVEYFRTVTSEDSFLSTYASRTSLKKALHEAGFEILIREGFKGKRNSTLAFKGSLKATFAPAGIS